MATMKMVDDGIEDSISRGAGAGGTRAKASRGGRACALCAESRGGATSIKLVLRSGASPFLSAASSPRLFPGSSRRAGMGFVFVRVSRRASDAPKSRA